MPHGAHSVRWSSFGRRSQRPLINRPRKVSWCCQSATERDIERSSASTLDGVRLREGDRLRRALSLPGHSPYSSFARRARGRIPSCVAVADVALRCELTSSCRRCRTPLSRGAVLSLVETSMLQGNHARSHSAIFRHRVCSLSVSGHDSTRERCVPLTPSGCRRDA